MQFIVALHIEVPIKVAANKVEDVMLALSNIALLKFVRVQFDENYVYIYVHT